MKIKKKYFILILFLIFSSCLVGLVIKEVLFKPYYTVENHNKDLLNEKKKDTKNYHAIAWLNVQGTDLDLPVLTINNQNPPLGREHFSWTVNTDDEYHNVMNICGHNIFNLSSSPIIHSDIFQRFEELMAFVYYDFAKENKYIQLTMGEEEYIYKIFSVSFLPVYIVNSFPINEYSKEQVNNYIYTLSRSSIYDYNVDVSTSDNIISLITCTRLFGEDDRRELVVSGRLVRKGERLSNYKVTKNNRYNKIDKLLKGDGDDENQA